jgi:acetoin utilization protein AcuB
MLVGNRMSQPLVTVSPDLTLPEAFTLMKDENIRRLVVVKNGKMVGLVTKNDLENAMPTKATSLSIWEINYLIDKIKVQDVMEKDVITTTEDTPIEAAAQLMVENKVSALPVMRREEVVGMITESDLFRLFMELFGAEFEGLRVVVEMSVKPGSMAALSQHIYQAGGDIIAFFGTISEETRESDLVTIKVRGVDADALKAVIAPLVVKIVDIREV